MQDHLYKLKNNVMGNNISMVVRHVVIRVGLTSYVLMQYKILLLYAVRSNVMLYISKASNTYLTGSFFTEVLRY